MGAHVDIGEVVEHGLEFSFSLGGLAVLSSRGWFGAIFAVSSDAVL